MKNRNGFTTIELVVVIVVIAVLAAVLIPTFSSVSKNSHISADEQVAYSISTQLHLWGDIKSENDLRDAINAYKGAGYYESKLVPTSAKYGKHYWFDIANQMVIVATTEELDHPADNIDPALNGQDAQDLVFAPDSLRVFTLGGKQYVLMDHDRDDDGIVGILTGFDFANSTVDGEGNPDVFNYDWLISKLTTGAENDAHDGILYAPLLSQMMTTAVISENGVFMQADENISHIYISKTATELVETDVVISNPENIHVYLPSNVEKINSNSLQFANAAYIHIKKMEEKLAIPFLTADCITSNCIIIALDGSCYKVDKDMENVSSLFVFLDNGDTYFVRVLDPSADFDTDETE